ncbi:hypothetical protein [Streptomyces sp. NPDC059828]|uniref:hypothetical protein n=1 Tax=Streptomyces sp. NPDC059828 TaxID=3346965 RepID=UPI00365BA314
MNGELLTAAALFTPAAITASVCLAGHLRARRADDAIAAVFAEFRAAKPTGTEPPPNGRETAPQPAAEPVRLATVIEFPTRRRDAA